MLPLLAAWTYEEGLPPETGIPGFGDITVLVSYGTRANIICSFTPLCGPGGPVLVPGYCTGGFRYTDRPEGLDYGSRHRTGSTGRDLGACLRHHTTC